LWSANPFGGPDQMSSQAPDVSPSSYGNNDDIHDLAFAKRGCCWIPFLTTDRPSYCSCIIGSDFWQRIKPADCTAKRESWWFQGWMKIRDWSELVAGPKWKTFLRRFNKKPGGGNPQHGKFQYDPSSYALNFDEGAKLYEDDDLLGRGFSSRYSLPLSCKSSMDFDKEGLLWDTLFTFYPRSMSHIQILKEAGRWRFKRKGKRYRASLHSCMMYLWASPLKKKERKRNRREHGEGKRLVLLILFNELFCSNLFIYFICFFFKHFFMYLSVWD